MRMAEDAALNSYGWVDKSSGSVRIPIERAMEILAKKGWPARKQEKRNNDAGLVKNPFTCSTVIRRESSLPYESVSFSKLPSVRLGLTGPPIKTFGGDISE